MEQSLQGFNREIPPLVQHVGDRLLAHARTRGYAKAAQPMDIMQGIE
jgi:hypothetical protein